VTRPSRRWWLAPLLLGAIFAVALWAPIPTGPNAARAQIVAQVGEHLPGWQITLARPSWEGGWAVVVRCGPRQVGFQLIPGHGLPPGDAWLHPDDSYSHARLATISDDRTYLVWYRDGERARSLSCRTELARSQTGRRSSPAD
jgi:hypothetical protein